MKKKTGSRSTSSIIYCCNFPLCVAPGPMQSPHPPTGPGAQQPFQAPPPPAMGHPQMHPGPQSLHSSQQMPPHMAPPLSPQMSMGGMGSPFPGPPPPGPGGFQQPGPGPTGPPGYPQQAGNSDSATKQTKRNCVIQGVLESDCFSYLFN